MQSSSTEQDPAVKQSIPPVSVQQSTMTPAVPPIENAGVGLKDAAGFAIPSLPAPRAVQQPESTGGIPQDVRTIMEMIGLDAGAELPPQENAVRETEPSAEADTSSASLMQAAANDADEETDSSEEDSSSESDSDSEDDAEKKTAPTPSSSAPMTASRHAELLAQLTSFVKGPAEDVEVDGVGYITEDSEDEDDLQEDMMDEGEVDIVMDGQAVDLQALRELMNTKKLEEETATTTTSQSKPKPKQDDDASSSSSDSSSDSDSSDSDEESSTLPARLAQVEMSDYEEEEETPSGPLKTEHEILEEPVQVPPFQRLGEGARVILAGEVVSFIKDPGLGVWEQWQRAQKLKEEEEASAKQDEREKVVEEEEKKVEQVMDVAVKAEEEPGQILESVVSVAEPGEIDVQVEVDVKVETSETTPMDATAGVDVKEEPIASTTTAAGAQPEPSSEHKPDISVSDPTPATTAPQTSTTAKRARNRAGKRRPNDNGKGKQSSGKPNGPCAPKSSGTVVVQALRPPAGTVKGGTDRLDEDGWLLDGSVICTGEGEAVAVVAEVFGPTAQPFYLLKLPPPPFSVPAADQLTRGTKLYYPADGDHAYVPVRMLKTDKRFKGTDASNLYDEEPAEHEMEWSDDEEEQAAKRKFKADKRGKKTANDNNALPRRQPHFDTASTAGHNSDDDEMSVHYGGAGDSSMRDDRSDAGYSVASSSARSRRVAQSYGDLYDTQASVGYRAPPETARGTSRGRGSARGARGGRVADRFGDAPPTSAPPQTTQRNQDGGRQIGRGVGRGRGGERGRGAERGRGRGGQQQQARGGSGRRQEQQQLRQQPLPSSANLPARPRDLSPTSAHIARVTSEAVSSNTQHQPQQPQMQQGYNPMMGMSSFGWVPQAMGQMPMEMGMPGMPMGMPMGMMGGQMFSPYFMPQQQQQQPQQSGGQQPSPAQTQGGQQSAPGMPAINPRFMQQYQQMMAQYQGQAQGTAQGGQQQ